MEELSLRPYFKSLFFTALTMFSMAVSASEPISTRVNKDLTQPAAVPSATISGTTTVCRNSAQPVITLTGSGETAPYTFVYNINGGPNITSPPTPAGQDFIEIPV